MIRIGASTANLYPMETERALDRLLQLGFRELEVFLNTESEAEDAFVRQLRARADEAGAVIRSVHPYVSGTEPYLLFSAYRRRYEDGLKIYRRLFRAAQLLGAPYVVMHGDKREGVLPVEDSIACFEGVYDLGRTYGITLLQENVVRFRASDPAYIAAMRRQLGDKARFVFDIKQCVRSGHSPEEMLDAMGDALAHVHISDHDQTHDCLMPGTGTVGYGRLFARLLGQRFSGSIMLELYRSNYGAETELISGRRYLENVLREEETRFKEKHT